jgi:hypothetical protein
MVRPWRRLPARKRSTRLSRSSATCRSLSRRNSIFREFVPATDQRSTPRRSAASRNVRAHRRESTSRASWRLQRCVGQFHENIASSKLSGFSRHHRSRQRYDGSSRLSVSEKCLAEQLESLEVWAYGDRRFEPSDCTRQISRVEQSPSLVVRLRGVFVRMVHVRMSCPVAISAEAAK